MKKLRWPLIILLILIILYQIPAPQADFFELYQRQDQAARQLREFMQRPVKTLTVDGITWRYLAGGQGAKTILFLHGMGGAYNLWWQQVAALQDRYRFITYSLPEEVDNLDKAAAGIRALLDEEKAGKIYLVGTSMGGYIAQYLLNVMPQRIEKAVLSNTFPPNKQIAVANAGKARAVKLMPEILVARLGARQLQAKLLPAAQGDSLLAAFLPSLPFSKKQFLNRYRVVVDPFFDNPGSYAVRRIQKLIIEADNDPLVEPDLRARLKERYADARVFTFHNAGHFPYINRAADYNAVLEAFLASDNPYLAVEKVIYDNYAAGRRQADTVLLNQAFAAQAVLNTNTAAGVVTISLADYLDKVVADGPQQLEVHILNGRVAHRMANFRVAFDYPGKRYIDNLVLLPTDRGWRIVNKTFASVK